APEHAGRAARRHRHLGARQYRSRSNGEASGDQSSHIALTPDITGLEADLFHGVAPKSSPADSSRLAPAPHGDPLERIKSPAGLSPDNRQQRKTKFVPRNHLKPEALIEG